MALPPFQVAPPLSRDNPAEARILDYLAEKVGGEVAHLATLPAEEYVREVSFLMELNDRLGRDEEEGELSLDRQGVLAQLHQVNASLTKKAVLRLVGDSAYVLLGQPGRTCVETLPVPAADPSHLPQASAGLQDIQLYKSGNLVVKCPPPADLVASKLRRFDVVDIADIRFLIAAFDVTAAQIKSAVRRLPTDIRRNPQVIANLRSILEDNHLLAQDASIRLGICRCNPENARNDLAAAYRLAFSPTFLIWELQRARAGVSDEKRKSLRIQTGMAYQLLGAFPAVFRGDSVALHKLARRQAESVSFNTVGQLRNLAAALGQRLPAARGVVPSWMIRSVAVPPPLRHDRGGGLTIS